ncbi:polysaccharide lyase 6 family protein [Saccharophagus degradans]|uniref:polysaccharide lyase 6 family protein n=1 Tax=Saccharophagus degradans TaxID=86304 RepID=UPI002477CD81|nr:polysaccharide lyase 6 family protein [Saccharophagus degradans]WGO99274.1 polysaccharide lyase 6 family protein [Saccharophagus degradans]
MKKENVNIAKQGLLVVLVSFFMSFSLMGCAKEILVNSQEQYAEALSSVKPGDTIVLANGEWKDFEIVFTGKGTEKAPITLTAQTKGKVLITGESNLALAGEHLVVSGLVFTNGYTPSDAVISFRTAKPVAEGDYSTVAMHSRVTEVVIDDFSNPERFETDAWVLIYGKHNRVDHSNFTGKRNKGVLMAVRLDTTHSRENHHEIDHNYFGPRDILGSNGGETLRIGTSHFSLSDSFTLVENNYFDRCNGELEIISNKSGSNKFIGNTFFESRGTLTMRHGHGNVIENNVFFGNGKDHTGGIRVINERQTVRNNYMSDLAGYRFGGGLVVMNGVPNSAINRYHQVKNAVIENNTLVNVDHIQLAAGSDKERTATPVDSKFSNNLIVNDDKRNPFTVYDDVSGITFSNNSISAASKELKKGFEVDAAKIAKNDQGMVFDASGTYGASKSLKPVRKQDVGASWFVKSEDRKAFQSGKTVKAGAGQNSIYDAVEQVEDGGVVELAAGDYVEAKTITINKTVTVKAAAGEKVNIEFYKKSLFEVVDGGSLQLEGLAISGASSPDDVGNAVVRTSRYSMLKNYRLELKNCEFTDLDVNRFFNVVSVSKSTLADNILLENVSVKKVTGSVLKLDLESDDYGIYNAEYVTIKNSQFEDVDGPLITYYRGGTDESTFGPHFEMTGSTLKNVGNGSKNKLNASLYLHGVQVTAISNNKWLDSKPVIIEHTVGEPVTSVVDNTFVNTAKLDLQELYSKKPTTAVIKNNTYKK